MIKKLRQRFILITMSSISLIFILILLALNIFMTLTSRRQGYALLTEYAERQNNRSSQEMTASAPDALPEPPSESAREAVPGKFERTGQRGSWFDDMRIFTVFYDTAGNITSLSAGKNPALTEAALTEMAAGIMKAPRERGTVSGYLYLNQSDDRGTRLYFLDYGPEKNMSMQLFYICLWVALAGILVIFIPVTLLSRWVTRPVRLAFDKQKQFIADASHELKTPLTIITANAEVLKGSCPDNKWLSHILDQSKRMSTLINSLLELARLDAFEKKQDFMSFDLSKAIRNAALSFESLAFEYGKAFEMKIEEGLTLYGNEGGIRQLVTILLDNAFKYSDDKGSILISLSRHGDKNTLLVRNTGKGISPEDQKRIFERFYRSDVSRSRESGGYGLGLSIAKSIAEAHKGHILVKSDGSSYTEFYVSL